MNLHQIMYDIYIMPKLYTIELLSITYKPSLIQKHIRFISCIILQFIVQVRHIGQNIPNSSYAYFIIKIISSRKKYITIINLIFNFF